MTQSWKQKASGCCVGAIRQSDETVEIFGRSRGRRVSPLYWRVPILLWSVAIIVWSAVFFWGTPPKFFLYMTHWGLILIAIESLFGIIVTYKTPPVEFSDATFGLPWYVKTYWVLYNIAIPVAFLITIFYWCLLKPSEKKVNYAPDPVLDVMLHAVNSVVMLIELISSAHPSRLLHVMQPVYFAFAYTVFTIVYYFAGGTDPWGNVFIYPLIDWSKPQQTIVVVAMTGLTLAVLHLAVVGIAALRDLIARRCLRDNTGIYNDGFGA